VPASYQCGTPIAVAFVFHGGGGNRSIARQTTCPNGDTTSAGCIDRVALAAGMAVVFADGTKVPGSELLSPGGIRTWNAGGGKNGYNCVSGNACNTGVDDMAYVRALVASVGSHLSVDAKRVFASGFSNGAALTQRLACQTADLFAAVAPVSGENQFALVDGGCAPAQRVAVLDVHGTADGCWPYAGGTGGCIDNGLYVSVAATLADWAARNGCGAVTSTALPLIAPADGTSVVRSSYAGCAAGGELQHLQIVGGGHFWPRGSSFSVTNNSGGVQSQQLDASQAVIDWFSSHGRP
jgi:polyhydroxybutyrate depolymerase